MTPPQSFGRRLFRRLQRFLPVEFRGDFGDSMASDIDDGAPRVPTRGATRFWSREIGSLLVTIVREHFDVLRQDLKYSLRTMRRTPGFTAMAVLMLGLGTGVNVAMFSIVDAVMIRSPFERPDELVAVRSVVNGRPTLAIPSERYAELLSAPGPLTAVGAVSSGSHVLTGHGDPMNVDDIECVTASMFGVFGTRPAHGRTFSPDEDRAGAAPTIVLSHDFWQELGGSMSALNSSFTINRVPVTVIGVMPKGFAGAYARADVQGWMPRGNPVKSAENSGCRQDTLNVFGRVRPNLKVEAVRSVLPGLELMPLTTPMLDEVRTPFIVLMVAVGCVLLIACFNVGGLQMERTLARRREVALRMAIGASRGRLVRQTLTENILLALTGASAGIIASALALPALVAMLPTNVPYIREIEINIRVLVATLMTASAVGLTAGVLPIFQMRRFAPAADLVDATRASEKRGSWGRRSLVVIEIALSIILLIGATLMVQTFLTLRPSQPGFDPERKVVMSVRLRGETPGAAEVLFDQLLERIRLSSAIAGAACSTYFPMSGNTYLGRITIGTENVSVQTNYTTPGFFSLMEIPIVAGRSFAPTDTRGSMPVVIVNQALASRIRPGGQVLGQTIVVRSQGGAANDVPIERTIVGILADTRNSGVDTRPRSEAYIPYAQNPVISMQVIAEARPGRETEAAGQLRTALRELRPELVVNPPRQMTAMIYQRLGARPFGAWSLAVIAALAVGLAAIGLMTTMGWWVSQRTREIGVRIAVGAGRGRVAWLVFRQGMGLALLGVAIGCAGAMGLTRFLSTWLYGVLPLDTQTFAGCAALMCVIAACAVFLPVRRVASVDPVVALKS